MRPRRVGMSVSVVAIGIVLWLGGAVGQADDWYAQDGLAIGGYDPVSYFTEHRPVIGTSSYTVEYQGVRFQFSSAAHREAFLSDPDRYVPQYGGYCAYGMAQGYKASTKPEVFTVYGGKLYLNYNLAVREQWLEDIPGHVSRADAHWPRVRSSLRVIP